MEFCDVWELVVFGHDLTALGAIGVFRAATTPSDFLQLIANLPQLIALAFDPAGEVYVSLLRPCGFCCCVVRIRLRCWCFQSASSIILI